MLNISAALARASLNNIAYRYIININNIIIVDVTDIFDDIIIIDNVVIFDVVHIFDNIEILMLQLL